MTSNIDNLIWKNKLSLSGEKFVSMANNVVIHHTMGIQPPDEVKMIIIVYVLVEEEISSLVELWKEFSHIHGICQPILAPSVQGHGHLQCRHIVRRGGALKQTQISQPISVRTKVRHCNSQLALGQ